MNKKIKNVLDNKKNKEEVCLTGVVVTSEIKKGQKPPHNPYLELELTDGESSIICRLFSVTEKGIYESENIVTITGQVNEYQGKKSVNISTGAIKKDLCIEDFICFDKEKTENQLASIANYLETYVGECNLKKVTLHLLNKYHGEFTKSVAAKSHHHNFVGGLLTHTSEVLNYCYSLGKAIEKSHGFVLDNSILYCGAILHDIGKIKAYTTGLLSGVLSTEGKLLDHITLSTLMIDEAYTELNFSKADADYLNILHVIVSHHSCKEWGSMVEPKTLEAFVISQADLMSARLSVMTTLLADSTSVDGWVKSPNSNQEFFKTQS